ncbi:sugar-binding domain-containing protein [Planctomycetota bacterium]
MTRWAKDVSPDNVWPEYPRPTMVREDWLNLNGLWDYAIAPQKANQPAEFDGQILVPFAPESALSGVNKLVNPDQRLWYRKEFTLPGNWSGKRILLHFGAVDWQAKIWVNDREMGFHLGGYDPFSFDITDALNESSRQEIVVSVWDPTNSGSQPRGKQVLKPRGIYYTRVTGIWQTVWLEPVPQIAIERLKTIPDIDDEVLRLVVDGYNTRRSDIITAQVLQGDKIITSTKGSVAESVELKINNPRLWSPDDPFLYDLKITLLRQGKVIDQVSSYFGMRKITLGKDQEGIPRIFLNHKQIFSYGPLDQGWWPDGLYTAPSDAALRYDLEVIKKLGCNMMRKHVKIEPERLYYWCDKLGIMVWQDMASGNNRTDEAKTQFELELKRMIYYLHNHPSIVMWVPFNEGWGQYDTPRLTSWISNYDPTRLVNNASGWADRNVGDVHDIHSYPGPAAPPVESYRAAVLGEFGGLGLPLKGHTWQEKENWGYRSYKTRQELTEAYLKLLERLRLLIGTGLTAAVYTQTTDVEIEVNGLMTYDREIIKMDVEKVSAANRKLYLPPPIIKPVVPTSQQAPQMWRYTTTKPTDDWYGIDFEDANWETGPAPFGRRGTPGITPRTPWTGSDIWMRRTFELSKISFTRPHLMIYHDEDAEVYLNGELIAKVPGYVTSYALIPLEKEGLDALKPGVNTLAVHCRQTDGGQGIDAGIVDIITKVNFRRFLLPYLP